MGPATVADGTLGVECVRHARLFFDRPDYDLATAAPGTFALSPHADMAAALERDYQAMAGMILGPPPAFEEVLASIRQIEQAINKSAT